MVLANLVLTAGTQVLDNPDEQYRRIGLESLIGDAINKERRRPGFQ